MDSEAGSEKEGMLMAGRMGNGKRKRHESWSAQKLRELKMALVPMQVDYAELEPQIGLLTHILDEAAGGMPQVIRAMRLSPDAMIQEFLRHYDRASARDRRIVPFEAFALAAKLNLMQLLRAVMVALREESVSLVKVITLTAHPTITRATVKSALMESGVADRKMLHERSQPPGLHGSASIGRSIAFSTG